MLVDASGVKMLENVMLIVVLIKYHTFLVPFKRDIMLMDDIVYKDQHL